MSGHLSRRNFIKKCGHSLGGMASYPLFQSALKISDIKGEPIDLAVVKGNPEKAVMKAIELLGGMQKFIHAKDEVFLKPNVSFPNPAAWGSTTSPEVVKTVAHLALQAGASRVIVADNTMREGSLCFEKTGIQAALKDLGKKVKIIPLQRESYFEEVTIPEGKALKSCRIAKLIKRCKVFINLPCAKSHSATEVSFGLKNLMGVIWDRVYFHSGTDLHTAIAELATVVRPHLTLLDATRALVTGGPTGPGKVQVLNTIIAGIDPLAVDSYAVTIENWNQRSQNSQNILHLSRASTLGIGEIKFENLSVKKEIL